MPTYDYECDQCRHTFELFQSITEPPQRICPACGRPKLRRLIGAGAAIVFKGSGFYQTDYRSESYRKRAAAETKAAGDSSSTSAKSPEGGSSETNGKSPSKSQGNGKPAPE